METEGREGELCSCKFSLKNTLRPSVCPSVRPFVTLMYRAWAMGWTSSKLIPRIISSGSSLLGATTSAM